MQFFQFSVKYVTNPFVINILTSKFHTDGPEEIQVYFTSLEVKFYRKISILNSYLEDICKLKNKIKLLNDENRKGNT